jgi:L-demethylnoviosyl transferase
MRVLFTTIPGCGHLFPMVPLAWALRCAGHQVLVAGPRAIAKTVRAAGLEHAHVGNTTRLDLLPEQLGPATRDFTAEPWVELAEHTVAESIDLVGQWRPEVVVSGYAEYAGPIAAALSGIPSVSHHWGLHMSDELTAAVLNERTLMRLHALQERFGLLPEETTPAATIDLCPASLTCFDSTGWLTMRHIPYGGAGIPSPWLWAHRTRPRVCVSLGSVPIRAGVDGLRLVASGLSGFDGEVVLTGIGSRSSALTDLPDNVRTAGWLPHDQVFPTCDLVIHHGGSGTAMNSLLFGLPQLVLPQMWDQFENAERLVASGAARSIGFDDRASGLVCHEVERLLTEPSHREHARRLRTEMEAMPAPGKIVAALEELATTRRRDSRLPSATHAASPLALVPAHQTAL